MPPTEKQLSNLRPQEPGAPGKPGAGRKKGSVSAKTIIKKWLEAKEKIKHPITGKEVTLTQLDIISLAQLKKARAGDTQAFNALLDRTEGKPEQKVQNAFPEGTEIAVTIGKPKIPGAED